CRVRGRPRARLPDLVRIPRRQGHGDGHRRFLRAVPVRGPGGRGRLCRGRGRDALRVARLDHGGVPPSARDAAAFPRARCGGRGGFRDDRASPRLSPREHPAAPRRDRAPAGTEGLVTRVAIVGTGAWGTALAIHGANTGLDVALLGRRPDVVARLAATRAHPALAGALPIPSRVTITTDARAAFAEAAAVLWSVSVQATAGELSRLAPFLPGVPLVATSKGLEIGSHRRTTEIMSFVTGRKEGLAVLSGPTFAAEVAGAAKNVVAIAAGLVDGLRLGHNTRAALLTRALAEIRRLGSRLGGSPETFSGLAGVGDL